MRFIPEKKARVRIRAFFCAFLLLLGMYLPQAQAATYPYDATTNDKVNMRRSASSSSVVLERLEKGQTVTVLGESGSYYKVSFNDRTGYVMKQYVGDPGASQSTATNTSPAGNVSGYPYQTTTKDGVNLRRSASSSAVILARIPKGAEITVEGEKGSYLKVRYEETSGYAMAEYIHVRTVATPAPTPAPNNPQTVNNAYSLLSNGASGKEVRALQQVLIELEYLSGSADGAFGAKTEAAVQACQKKNGLAQTGEADAALQTLLYENKPINANGKAVNAMTLPPIDGVTIRLNNQGDAVTQLQERLAVLKYYTGAVNGVCTSDTIAAVKEFQNRNGLKADGLAGNATQQKLYGNSALAKDETATPTPVPVPDAPGATVRQGDEGDAVRTVQKRLKDLGYLSGAADGKFGQASVTALKAFQQTNGLKVDGVAGAATQNVLFSASAVPAEAAVTPAPTATPLTPDNVIEIRSGTRGIPVLNLQKRLTELGYYTARMDGDYLAADIAAVKAFQKANGLKVDGIAGYETQALLYSDKAVPGPNAAATPTPSSTVAPSLNILRQGDRGNEVTSLQQRLIQLGFLTGKADGSYGIATASAVVAFQKANGLVRDGVAGSKTLEKLYSTEAVGAPAATPSPTPPLSLKQGDMNEAVRAMQTVLINLGYLKGKADGDFGLQTLLALQAFQKQNGLSADGVAGTQTLAILTGGNAKPAPAPADPGAAPTPKPTTAPPTTGGVPNASQVRYANWYTEIRARCRLYPDVTIYDYSTGLSWKVHLFSLGAHADGEPVTAEDTATMVKAFGGKYTWTPKPVWVIMSDGRVYMASTHDNPHEVDHNQANNFPGHLCVHFPRTASEVAAIGPYATSHQAAIDAGWKVTQNKIK